MFGIHYLNDTRGRANCQYKQREIQLCLCKRVVKIRGISVSRSIYPNLIFYQQFFYDSLHFLGDFGIFKIQNQNYNKVHYMSNSFHDNIKYNVYQKMYERNTQLCFSKSN